MQIKQRINNFIAQFYDNLFRLLHTKRLRREIARLEQMEKEIAIKTTQISEMVTPEPKSRNGWTPGSSSRRENRSDSQVHHVNKIWLIYYVTFPKS